MHRSDNKVYSNDDQGRVYQKFKFHDTRGRGSCDRVWPYKSYSENALFFLKSSSLPPGIDKKTMYTVMITK